MNAAVDLSKSEKAFIETSKIKPGKYNPRKHFDKSKLKELASSIKQTGGLIQPIVVRPVNDDEYEIVAGERRWRATQLTDLKVIEAKIVNLSDDEVIRWATAENTEREDMSAIEESYAAQRALTIAESDTKAAAAILGWTTTKLNKRILLLNLCKKGQKALMKKVIHVGHAELLSTLTTEMQETALESVIEKGITVSELKAKLSEFAYQLSAAIFNTEKCNGCPNNSSTQYNLFDECVGEAQCLNPECYELKQNEKMAYIKKSKEEDYNVVYLDVERTPDSFNFLIESEVGATQLNQCHQCANYGAIISTRRETLGEADEDICFDVDCYQEKIKAIQGEKGTTDATSQKTRTTSTTQKRQEPASKPDNTPPKKVKEYQTTLYKKVVAEELGTNKHLMLAMNAAILLESLPKTNYGHELGKKLTGMFNLRDTFKDIKTHRRDQLIEALYDLPEATLHEIIGYAITVNSASGDNNPELADKDNAVCTLLNILQPDLSNHFVLDKAYMERHQKKGLIAVLKEAGFDEWYNKEKDDPVAFAKLTKEKIATIIETVENSQAPLVGFVPQSLKYNATKTQTAAVATAQDAA